MCIQSIALIQDNDLLVGRFRKYFFLRIAKKITSPIIETIPEKSSHIDINLHAEEVVLNIKQAISYVLLINELINNSTKHGFAHSEDGSITLKLQKKQNTLILLISNTGEPVNCCIVVQIERRSEYEDRILYAIRKAEKKVTKWKNIYR